MATKFIQLDEAAEMLGITVERLLEMRSQNDIRGFRDGSTWKFKSDDIEKLVGTVSAAPLATTDEIEFDSDLELTLDDSSSGSEVTLGEETADEDNESVLLSERELGGSDITAKSTIIDDSAESPGDSDITLADAATDASDVQLVGDSMIQGSEIGLADSDIGLGIEDEPAVTAEEPAASDAGSDLSLNFDEVDALDLDAATPDISSSPSSNVGSDLSLTADSGLSLEGEEELIELGSASGDSEIQGKSSIELSDDADEELVLGEGSGSDITTSAGDSGISLMDPADSGLSLEEAPIDLDLGGSAIDESLVLGEDDMITLGDDLAGASSATALKSDDDFLLTPLDENDEDLSESGSQVIPLDEAGVGYDQSAATMLNVEGQAGMEILEEDLADAQTMIGGAGAAAPLGVPQPAVGVMMQPTLPEAPYSVWNLLSLFGCVAILSLSGMLIYDVVRQMGSWQGTYPVNSGLMEAIVNIFS